MDYERVTKNNLKYLKIFKNYAGGRPLNPNTASPLGGRSLELIHIRKLQGLRLYGHQVWSADNCTDVY